jgi:hypothetical protein
MRRRHFLGLLGIGISLVLARKWGLARKGSGPRPARCTFHAAGVRFNATAARLSEGDPIEVRRERFEGEICYGLFNRRGERLGYVPKHLLRDLADKPIRRAFLQEVRPFAVPWKRLRVTVELA